MLPGSRRDGSDELLGALNAGDWPNLLCPAAPEYGLLPRQRDHRGLHKVPAITLT